MNDQSFDEAIFRIEKTGKNQHLNIEAFYFLRDALDASTLKYKKDKKNKHFTGAELCDAIAEYALENYGHLAYFVLSRMGITKTEDFGLIVYALINEGIFGKTAEDKQSDFDNVFDLKEKLYNPMFPNTINQNKQELLKFQNKNNSERK